MQHDAYHILAFYRFTPLPDCAQMQPRFKAWMLAHDIKGTVILASEGINATVSGTPDAIDAFRAWMEEDTRLAGMRYKHHDSDSHAFARTKVKLKSEIIALGIPATPSERVGTYVPPEAWDALLEDPEVLVIDTRNDYEVHLGRFRESVNPETRTFRELPEFVRRNLDTKKHRKIAMYCTGGIRCEKFSSYLLAEGFEQVYQLEGGILNYLAAVPEEESAWEGTCYVFDERVGLKHDLTPDAEAGICPGCGHALYTKDRLHPAYIPQKQCRHC